MGDITVGVFSFYLIARNFVRVKAEVKSVLVIGDKRPAIGD